MSYSRWSDSYWYTFYTCSSGYTKDTQRFEVCGITTFTYEELKKNINECLKEIFEIELKEHLDSKPVIIENEKVQELLSELREYMEEFIKDVEDSEYFQISINGKEYDIIKDETSWGSYNIIEGRWKFHPTDKIIKQIKKDINEDISIKEEEILINIINKQKMLTELDK